MQYLILFLVMLSIGVPLLVGGIGVAFMGTAVGLYFVPTAIICFFFTFGVYKFLEYIYYRFIKKEV